MRRALGLLLVLPLSGCVQAYLRPSAPGGKVVRAWCPPTRSYVLFERAGVVVGLQASPVSKEATMLTLSVEVPEGRTVTLLEETIAVAVEARVPARLALVPTPAGPLRGASEDRPAARQTPYGRSRHAVYVFQTGFPAGGVVELIVKPPLLSLDGQALELPEVRFSRARGFSLTGFGC